MPTLVCGNGHYSEFRNFRGSRGAGTICPYPGCASRREGLLAGRCNFLGYFDTSWGVRRGRCDRSKGHPLDDGGHYRGDDQLRSEPDEGPAPGDYPEEGAVPTAVQNAWNEAHS